jgi:hypothetical protein
MKPRFTPGPWKYFNPQIRPGGAKELVIGATLEGDIDVATAYVPVTHPDTARANAQLVATAPELLAALEKSFGLLQGIHDLLPGDKPEWEKLQAQIVDVILRAKGEA